MKAIEAKKAQHSQLILDPCMHSVKLDSRGFVFDQTIAVFMPKQNHIDVSFKQTTAISRAYFLRAYFLLVCSV